MRDQFETNFFGPVNVIKAMLPKMRMRGSGHIIVLGSISTFFILGGARPSINSGLSRSPRYPWAWDVLLLRLGLGGVL